MTGVCELAAIHYYQLQQQFDARVINLAGKQRMLSQMAAKYALSAAYKDFSDKDNLGKTIAQYEDNLHTLHKGGTISDKTYPAAPDYLDTLFKENITLLESFKKGILEFDARDNGQKAAINEKAASLLDISSRITREFEAIAWEKSMNLRVVFVILTAIGVLIFIVGGLKVYFLLTPLKTLANSVAKVGAGDFSNEIVLSNSNDEISDLACAFNDMVRSLASTSVSQDYLNCIINAMGDMLIVIDIHGMIKTVNRAVSTVLMYDIKELIGTPVVELFSDATTDQFKAVCDIGPAAPAINRTEGWLRTKDGGKVAVQCSFSMMHGVENGDIVCVATDITVRKRYEDDLRKLSIAVEQSLSSIVITDINGNIEFVNNKFTESTGYTLSEVKGKTPNVLKSGKQPLNSINACGVPFWQERSFAQTCATRERTARSTGSFSP